MAEQSQNSNRDNHSCRRCASLQYLQTFSTVKSHSRARATFQNIAYARKQKGI